MKLESVVLDDEGDGRVDFEFADPSESESTAALLAIGAGPVWNEWFHDAGFAVACLPAGAPDVSNRVRLAELTRVLRWLEDHPSVDEDLVGVVGFGTGGTEAYLLGCHTGGIAAVVDYGGPLVYPELDAKRPMQPLEMALNLSAPLQVVFGGDDADLDGHLEDLQRTLDQFMKRSDVVRVPGATPDFFDAARSGYDEGAARNALERTLAFLRSELDLESA